MKIYNKKSYKKNEKNLDLYNLKSFNNDIEVKKYAIEYDIYTLINQSDNNKNSHNVQSKPEILKSELNDLCRLHWLALTRKSINILELGSGYSTVILANAMKIMSSNFLSWAKENVRCDLPFHVYSVDEDQYFLSITKERLESSDLSDFVTLNWSSVELFQHESRISTIYSKLPNISPDLIYLDGPSQIATNDSLNGISFNNVSRMPLSADILKIEFLLEPGTLIIIDGRTQNARFLKAFLKRKWEYFHDVIGDIHLFELQEDPLGAINRKKLSFCLDNKWLIKNL